MRFKSVLCRVMCLVITVTLQSATAQHDSISIESLNYKMERLEQNIMERIQAQDKELIEKLDAQATNAQLMAEHIENLRNITVDLLAGQSEILTHLTSVKNDLQHHNSQFKQEKSCDNEIHKLQNSTNVQHTKVIETLTAQNITHNFVANQSDDGKQLTNVKNESIEGANESNIDVTPSSCTTLSVNATGTYNIRPAGDVEPFMVRCDFEENYNLGGGWTVFQRRFNDSVDFYRNWTMYKSGFGDVNGEHWLGLEKLHAMTKFGRHELLIVLEDHEGNSAYAHYDRFEIRSEPEKYMLIVGSYSGTAGDSLIYHNGMKFSTFDQENNIFSKYCATKYHGAWWFGPDCFYCHLNAKYYNLGKYPYREENAVIWYDWKGYYYSLKSTKMMLRRCSR